MPENIEKVFINEFAAVVCQYKYLRPGNVKYTHNTVNLTKSYHDLSARMDIFATFDMLVKSKRKIFIRFVK